MSVARRAALGAVLCLLALAPAAALAHAGSGAHHSLRAPVTDENFYFVMADRFQNGDAANDNGGLPPGKTEGQSGFDPTGKGWYHGGDLEGAPEQARLHQEPRHDGDLAHAELQEQGRAGQQRVPVRRLPRLLDHRLHPDRPAPRHQRRPRHADPPRARHGHEGLLRHHLQPHRRRHPLRGGRRAGLQVEGRVAVQDRLRHAVRRPRLRGREHVPGAGARAGSRRARHPARRSASRTARACRTPSATSRCPAWLNDVSLYHNRGNTTFVGENSQYGDFFGLDDLFTENPKVVNGMIDIYKTWIRDFRIDGFRMDTMKHVDDDVLAEVRAGDRALRASRRACATSTCSARSRRTRAGRSPRTT